MTSLPSDSIAHSPAKRQQKPVALGRALVGPKNDRPTVQSDKKSQSSNRDQ